VTSFTSPKAIPMLRDAEEVMGRIRRVPGVEYTVLVPNLRGAERALESRADELNLVMSVSETTTWPTCACRASRALPR
jgi:hydroxymethylglutaryl-CoA lyase